MRRDASDPSMPLRRRRRESRGFALIAALVLLAVLGTTGALMLRVTALQSSATSQAVLGERAEWAAHAGKEWARAAAIAAVGCPSASSTLDLSGGALSGHTVVVSCTESRHVEDDAERLSLHLSVSVSEGILGQDLVFRQEDLAIAFVDPATLGGGAEDDDEEEEDDEDEDDEEEEDEEDEEEDDEEEEDEDEEEDDEEEEEEEDDEDGECRPAGRGKGKAWGRCKDK